MPKQEELPEGFKVTELGPLPEHWQAVELGRIATQSFGGGTPSTKESGFWDGPIPWTTTAVIGEGDVYLKTFQRGITDKGLQQSSTRLAPKGSVLIGTRVGVGKSVVTTFDVAINQDLTVIILQPNALPEFVVLALKTPTLQQLIADRKRGTTIKGIPREDILTVPIPLPPLPEQRDIAHVLRTVQQAKEATERVIAATRELKKSLMRHLFTYGPVPVEQADKVPLKETEIGLAPEQWEVVRFDELFESRLGKMLSQAVRTGRSPRPYVRNANVQWGKVDVSDLYEMDFSDTDDEQYGLKYGDVLICEGGEVGRTAIWRNEIPHCYYQKAIHRVRPRGERVSGEFLMYHMMHAFLIRRSYGDVGTNTTIAHLPGIKLKALPVPSPPRKEQNLIVETLEAVGTKLSAEELRKNSLENLFKTLLHHLMTGKVRVHDLQLPSL
jgi:type I restriction enzyme S subunit